MTHGRLLVVVSWVNLILLAHGEGDDDDTSEQSRLRPLSLVVCAVCVL
jgi:hypothetical protein